MYAKVFNLKFVKPTDAKVASSYFAENLAKFIRPCNMQSVSISLGPCGSLTITAKFDSGSDLKTFMDYYDAAREDFGKTDYFAARFIGERIMNDGMSNNLAIRIELPDNEQVVDIDYDDPLDPEAETFVFEGPMTNKRKTMWDKFSSMFVSEAKAGQLDTDVVQFVEAIDEGPLTKELYQRYESRLAQSDRGLKVFDEDEMMGRTKSPTRQ